MRNRAEKTWDIYFGVSTASFWHSSTLSNEILLQKTDPWFTMSEYAESVDLQLYWQSGIVISYQTIHFHEEVSVIFQSTSLCWTMKFIFHGINLRAMKAAEPESSTFLQHMNCAIPWHYSTEIVMHHATMNNTVMIAKDPANLSQCIRPEWRHLQGSVHL
jgi:hypothetical protein